MKLVFLDTETTGLSKTDRLCQLAYKIGDDMVNELFNPPVPMNIEAQAVHHISPEILSTKPAFVESEHFQIVSKMFATDTHVLVAHNAPFDIGMLNREGVEVKRYICTKKLAQYLMSSDETVAKYNLQYLRLYFKIELPDAKAHDAEGDVMILEAVFNKLYDIAAAAAKEKAKAKGKPAPKKADIINRIIEISMHPVQPIQRMPFGKHKGKMLSEAVREDKNYFTWLLTSRDNDTHGDELMTTIKHLLSKS